MMLTKAHSLLQNSTISICPGGGGDAGSLRDFLPLVVKTNWTMGFGLLEFY